MRVGRLALAIVGGLAPAGLAAAQSDMMMMGRPPAYAPDQFTASQPPSAMTRQERYWLNVQGLRDKMLRMKAKDGGQLSAEHAAGLQHELDALNRRFGVKAAPAKS